MLKNFTKYTMKKKKTSSKPTKLEKKSETESKKLENFSNLITQSESYNMNTTNQEQTNQTQGPIEQEQNSNTIVKFQLTEENIFDNFEKFQELFVKAKLRKEQQELEKKEERYKQIDEEIDELEKRLNDLHIEKDQLALELNKTLVNTEKIYERTSNSTFKEKYIIKKA